MMKKAALAFLVMIAVTFCAGCISDTKRQPNAFIETKCVKVKDINVLELEDYGEVRLWLVEKPHDTEDYEKGIDWLREQCENKSVTVWFGEQITYDEEDRPYAMVFFNGNKSCANLLLIAYFAYPDTRAPIRPDFLEHPAWKELIDIFKEKIERRVSKGLIDEEEAATLRYKLSKAREAISAL